MSDEVMETRCTWTGMAEAENHYTANTPTLGIGLCEYLYSLSTLLVALVGVYVLLTVSVS